ncbi:uncharacterized protein LOC136096469 [Hydra vulgaris]|uniref:uncharacterized protein LOC136096469 n=1 Tax=Hydra vulgaris TaxID=6087 RepID=UPI0032E9C0B4
MKNDLLSSRESESDDQSDKDFEDIEQPFILSSLEEDIFINKFSDWLYSNDGGKKPRSTCSKHKSTIMSMVRSGDSPVDYKNLFNREFINVWMTKMQDAGREAGTIKTYLGSLVHFYNFVVISGDPRFDENDYNKINKMKTVIKVWCQTLWKAIERRKYEKQIEDMKRFPTGEQVCNFDKCDLAKEAINILKAFVADRSLILNRKSYCLIRDCLIAQVLFDNASRPAAISNMTLGEFKSSVSQNDAIVVRVLHHKNDYKGPANITFQHEVYKRVQMYINFVCQRLPDVNVRDCDPVFLSFNGSKMDSSMITT